MENYTIGIISQCKTLQIGPFKVNREPLIFSGFLIASVGDSDTRSTCETTSQGVPPN